MKARILAIALTALALAPNALGAQDLSEILGKNKDNPRPPASKAEMRLVIKNKSGQARERKIVAWSSVASDVTRQMLVFESPSDVKGTRFLTVAYDDPSKADEQAIYIPSFRKVRQIGTSGGDSKTGAFLGSDFSYADLGTLEEKDYRATLTGKETVNGVDYWKVTYAAVSPEAVKNYGYGKVVKLINASNYTTWQTECHDASGKLVKRSVIEGQRLVDGKYWQFDRIVMNNLETGGSSVWEFVKSENLTSVDPGYFTLKFLEKGRL